MVGDTIHILGKPYKVIREFPVTRHIPKTEKQPERVYGYLVQTVRAKS